MRASERREHILAWVRSGKARVDELARALDVTESTIRRDLARLDADGKITRTYGGAVVGHGREPSLHERELAARQEKDAIARHAAELVGGDGDTVLLDAGTTTGRLAHHLRVHTGLTVATSGLSALNELAGADGVTLILLGGHVRHVSQGVVGPYAEMVLRRLTVDRAFLGADGLVAGRGICEAEPTQAALKELMAGQAREVYVLADSTKLGQAPLDAWAPLPPAWTLITDDGARPEQLAPFRELTGVRVVTASTG